MKKKSLEMLPLYKAPVATDDAPCCGPPAGPASSVYERPGYALCDFVDGFLITPAGPVPQIKTRHERQDQMGTFMVRLGIRRNDYKVAPGLYAVGRPDAQAPVLVTANYKLTFDHLRRHLAKTTAWILVLDTRGINVWCAAGKGTFGTREVIQRVQESQLTQVVSHRKIILPQLGAPGVAAHKVKKGCGFEVVWGPVQAKDLPAFLRAGFKADEPMRRVTFTFTERLVLVPVELSLMGKYFLWTVLTVFLLSGIGTHLFSISMALERGLLAMTFCLVGMVAGCALVPLLLPWIPGRAFAFKGFVVGLVAGILGVVAMRASIHISLWPATALVLVATAISSYAAMNFTGTTPYTSPTGVEKEMRRAIPLQLGAVLLAAGLWVGSAFFAA
jgi:hypothetical protein